MVYFNINSRILVDGESTEATLRRRSILFVGFVARMEETRLPKCVMFGELVGGTRYFQHAHFIPR